MLKEWLSKESGRFGDRYCDLTVIGDVSQVDRFTNALESCFLNEREIELWQSGCSFVDPWPENIVRLIDQTEKAKNNCIKLISERHLKHIKIENNLNLCTNYDAYNHQ